MYCVRDNKVKKIEVVKENKKGTGAWCKFEGVSKLKLVSYSKMFETKEDAVKSVKRKIEIKKLKKEQLEKEFNKKKEIAFKIMEETGDNIPLLTYACATIGELKDVYKSVLKNKERESFKSGL